MIYSYNAFSDQDLIYKDYIDPKEISKIDTIDISNMSLDERSKMVLKTNEDIFDDALEDGNSIKYAYNDFNIIYRINSVKYYSVFHIVDENMYVDIYSKNTNIGKTIYCQYIIKTEHAYQLYINLTDILATKKKIIDSNLYVIPMFMYIPKYMSDKNRYIRVTKVSKYLDNIKDLERYLNNIDIALGYMFAINHILISNKNDIHIGDRNIRVYTQEYIAENDKLKLVTKRKEGKDGKIVISTNDGDVKDIIRRECDYRYQVSGHIRHYWCGSKKDGTLHLETRWIESFWRNTNKKYKIIKKYILK